MPLVGKLHHRNIHKSRYRGDQHFIQIPYPKLPCPPISVRPNTSVNHYEIIMRSLWINMPFHVIISSVLVSSLSRHHSALISSSTTTAGPKGVSGLECLSFSSSIFNLLHTLLHTCAWQIQLQFLTCLSGPVPGAYSRETIKSLTSS